jgi:hypothetical protein
VAFVVLQVSVALAPVTTLVGLAFRVTVGAGGGGAVTLTVAVALTLAGVLPLAPAQVKV